MTEQEKNHAILKSAINKGLQKFEAYWEYREDLQAEIVESVFDSLKQDVGGD